MTRLSAVHFLAIVLAIFFGAFELPLNSSAQMMNMPSKSDQPMSGKHQDHEAKHGGIFFMAMNQEHHLEGVFIRPGIFRIYLYDAYTKPLSKSKIKEATGTVQVGDSPDAPKIPLMLSKDGASLEVSLPKAGSRLR